MRPACEQPGPGQRSVWDFPRPPAYEQWGERVEVRLGGELVAATEEAWCALETSHPPTYYLPASCFAEGALVPAEGTSVCEWKGLARYADLAGGGRVAAGAAWTYPDPRGGAAVLRDHWALYPALMDSCTVDGAVVEPQPGRFYGGWITPRVVGPFKGEPGTLGW